jgi:hypothetical protein
MNESSIGRLLRLDSVTAVPHTMKRRERAGVWATVALVLGATATQAARVLGAVPEPAAAAPIVQVPVKGPPPTARKRERRDAAIVPPESCRKFPAGKRIVKLNLKPDTELADLVAWISSITCKQFILPGNVASTSKKVTIYAPQLITPEEAYRLFLDALDSVGLTVERTGRFLQIIETAKAKSSPIPFYGADGNLWSARPKAVNMKGGELTAK